MIGRNRIARDGVVSIERCVVHVEVTVLAVVRMKGNAEQTLLLPTRQDKGAEIQERLVPQLAVLQDEDATGSLEDEEAARAIERAERPGWGAQRGCNRLPRQAHGSRIERRHTGTGYRRGR